MNDTEMNISAPRRLTFIDSLRGFALFGVFGANLFIFSGYTYMNDSEKAAVTTTALDKIVHLFESFVVENKFMGLFSFLFGISFWLFLDRVGARGAPATKLFYRRIGWLFVIGCVHGWLLWCFDILRFYALWAIVLPLFVRVRLSRLLVLTLSVAVLAPALIAGIRAVLSPPSAGPEYDAMALLAFSTGSYVKFLSVNWQYDWYLTNSIGQLGYQLGVFGRLLLGLYAARAFDLSNLGQHRSALIRILFIAVPVGAVGNTIFAGEFLSGSHKFFLALSRRLMVEAGYLGFTLTFATGLALLYLRPRWKNLVALLAPLGQMALTAYLLQTVFGIWLFYGFAPGPHLMGKIGPAWLGLIWLVGYAVQVVLAYAWMRRFRFGPAEWLWRTLTYWQVQPMKRVSQNG
jgi:uncharacterized protein